MRMEHFRANLNDAEAFFRNAHVLSFDVSAMMSAYAPGNILTSPNGLSGTEACQIFRYAGFSPHMNSIGIYEYNPHLDQNHLTAKQLSQMLWYFLKDILFAVMKLHSSMMLDSFNIRWFYPV